MLTEGITWVMTGIGIGMAFGAFISGWVIDVFGASQGFWVSVAAGAMALATVVVGQRALGGKKGLQLFHEREHGGPPVFTRIAP